MSLYYLGSFPPPRGGVTVKNENLLEALKSRPETSDIIPVDFSKIKRRDLATFRLLKTALKAKDSTFVIGVAGRKYRKWMIRLLYRINRPALERSVLILMGGLAASDIVNDRKVCRCAAGFRKIYAETESMVRMLQDAGLSAGYYPNGRFQLQNSEDNEKKENNEKRLKNQGSRGNRNPQLLKADINNTEINTNRNNQQNSSENNQTEKNQTENLQLRGSVKAESEALKIPLRIVYFSLISEPKGAERTLQAAAKLPDMKFVFYGPIATDYKEKFLKTIQDLHNVSFRGLFQGDSEAVYRELAGYDLVVLPTDWKAEGIPGILVEAKIAGIAAVVSDFAFNSEIVEDGVSGIVLKENTPEALEAALKKLDQDREFLAELKRGSQASAEKYYIENYMDDMVGQVKGK